MKRKWWLAGIVASCLLAGACSGQFWSLAVKLHQRIGLSSDGRGNLPGNIAAGRANGYGSRMEGCS